MFAVRVGAVGKNGEDKEKGAEVFERRELLARKASMARRERSHEAELEAELEAEIQMIQRRQPGKPLAFRAKACLWWICGRFYQRGVAPRALKLTNSGGFQALIIGAILAAGVNVGLGTYPKLAGNWWLGRLDDAVLVLFVAECALKIVSEGLKPWR